MVEKVEEVEEDRRQRRRRRSQWDEGFRPISRLLHQDQPVEIVVPHDAPSTLASNINRTESNCVVFVWLSVHLLL